MRKVSLSYIFHVYLLSDLIENICILLVFILLRYTLHGSPKAHLVLTTEDSGSSCPVGPVNPDCILRILRITALGQAR